MVEWDGLENRCTGNRTVGSNPTLSANLFRVGLEQARHSDDLDSLLNVMRRRNMDCENPQILKLIRLVAQSAWRYERDSAH